MDGCTYVNRNITITHMIMCEYVSERSEQELELSERV